VQLRNEIDEFIIGAVAGKIYQRLTFSANKVYKQEGNVVRTFKEASARSSLD
jgi:hypothetical protein